MQSVSIYFKYNRDFETALKLLNYNSTGAVFNTFIVYKTYDVIGDKVYELKNLPLWQ